MIRFVPQLEAPTRCTVSVAPDCVSVNLSSLVSEFRQMSLLMDVGHTNPDGPVTVFVALAEVPIVTSDDETRLDCVATNLSP
jgi:hypothetical protein